MTIQYANGSWQCTEVYMQQALGYGIYDFLVGQPVDNLGNGDLYIVLGLFVYRDDAHEIDIEFSRWGSNQGTNADYCVQPGTAQGSCPVWTEPPNIPASHQAFNWTTGRVVFTSTQQGSTTPFYSHTYTSTGNTPVPTPSGMVPHINFWLFEGQTKLPTTTKLDVVLTNFKFTAIGDPSFSLDTR